jgi:large subunit ribosomal protein L15
MELHKLQYASGSRKNRKRVGRGPGSGHGKTATRGENGQRSRSGAKFRNWFEGGQMPLQRRVPKFGFTPPFRKEYQPVNLYGIQKLIDDKKFDGDTLTAELLFELGLISFRNRPYKILGGGDLNAKLTVEANAFTESAKQKIEAAGGTIKII